MSTYSVYNLKIDNLYLGDLVTATVSGTFTQSLADGNMYRYNLSGNTILNFSDATISVYNFLVNAGTYSFSLATASSWKVSEGSSLGLTGSIMLSGMYDGSKMWVSYIEKMTDI